MTDGLAPRERRLPPSLRPLLRSRTNKDRQFVVVPRGSLSRAVIMIRGSVCTRYMSIIVVVLFLRIRNTQRKDFVEKYKNLCLSIHFSSFLLLMVSIYSKKCSFTTKIDHIILGNRHLYQFLFFSDHSLLLGSKIRS